MEATTVETNAPVEPPEFVLFIQGCDVIEANLARKLLYLCGFRQRRVGDNLLVFSPKDPRDTSREGRVTGFYAQEADCPEDDAVGSLFVDEGFYSDALRHDMSRGFNDPWSELIDMTSLLGILARHFEPQYEIKPSPYIGHGRSKMHYMTQYIDALVSGDQSKHPRVRIER